MLTSAGDQMPGVGLVVDSARERSWEHSRGLRRLWMRMAKWGVYSGRGVVAKLMRVHLQVGGEGEVRKVDVLTVIEERKEKRDVLH
jgi:hypothetical protein